MKQKKNPPTIIARQNHGISRSMVSNNALRILYRLKEHGFAGHLVGGCVRDLLLGREPKDFDVVTNATPGEIKRLFRNCRLVGRRFRLAHLHFKDEIIEVATFRSQATDEPEVTEPQEIREVEQRHRQPRMLKSDDGMILRDNVYGTPAEDALRRDFTVNALAYNIADFSIIDYTGGLADLNAGVIRMIGDPAVRFQEDPVRMLRAVRFTALLGFTMEKQTHDALCAAADTIVRAAPPRLYDELLKLFLSGEGSLCYSLLRQTGLFAALFPHFSTWLDGEQHGFPHTRFGESLSYIDSCRQRGNSISQPLLLALLFGEYFTDKCERLRQRGAPWQQCVDAAVAEFMGETCPIVMITNKVAMALRDIIGQQQRLTRMPGRKHHLFMARPDFTDILTYCQVTRGTQQEVAAQLTWWHEQAAQGMGAPLQSSQTGEDSAPHQRPRKRRRRRKAQSASRQPA